LPHSTIHLALGRMLLARQELPATIEPTGFRLHR
jgi:hypothetical protein